MTRRMLTTVASVEGATVKFADGYEAITYNITSGDIGCRAILYLEGSRENPKILGVNLVKLEHGEITIFRHPCGPLGVATNSLPIGPIPLSVLREGFDLEIDTCVLVEPASPREIA